MQTPRIRTPPGVLVWRLLSDPTEDDWKAFKSEKGAPGNRCFSDLDFRLRPAPPEPPGINEHPRGVLAPWNFLRAARGRGKKDAARPPCGCTTPPTMFSLLLFLFLILLWCRWLWLLLIRLDGWPNRFRRDCGRPAAARRPPPRRRAVALRRRALRQVLTAAGYSTGAGRAAERAPHAVRTTAHDPSTLTVAARCSLVTAAVAAADCCCHSLAVRHTSDHCRWPPTQPSRRGQSLRRGLLLSVDAVAPSPFLSR